MEAEGNLHILIWDLHCFLQSRDIWFYWSTICWLFNAGGKPFADKYWLDEPPRSWQRVKNYIMQHWVALLLQRDQLTWTVWSVEMWQQLVAQSLIDLCCDCAVEKMSWSQDEQLPVEDKGFMSFVWRRWFLPLHTKAPRNKLFVHYWPEI